MAVDGELRGKKMAGDELRAAVRKFCLAEFERRLGSPWSEASERRLRYAPEHPLRRKADTERKARAVYEQLRKAMLEAQAFANSERGGGRVAIFLRWWVPRFVGPLLEHASMQAGPKNWGENLEDARALLAHSLDNYDVFQLPAAVGGGSSFLDAREIAIVSLLVGNWPESVSTKLERTIADIIELETATMRHHIKAHGQRDIAPDEGLIAKRGVKHRRPKHEK